MVLAISRFRVADGMEEAVRSALLHCPCLVDRARGFLGMESFQERGDPVMFYVVTRWTDESSFRAWHTSQEPFYVGMPQRLKLESSGTELVVIERLTAAGGPRPHEVAADEASLIARALERTATFHLVAAGLDGTIRFSNRAWRSLVAAEAGAPLWTYLTEADGELLRQKVGAGQRWPDPLLLNFVSDRQSVHTLHCHLDIHPDGLVILGELPQEQNQALGDELLSLNNDLATLTRENQRKSRELERALRELKSAQAALVHMEKMSSLGRLTAGVAHEINNPLAFIKSNHGTLGRDVQDILNYLELVKASLEDIAVLAPEVHRPLALKYQELGLEELALTIPRRIADNQEGLERVRGIVMDLRNFSRLDEGDWKRCDVTEGLAAALRFLTPLLKERNVQLETDFAPLPPVLCAPGQLNQALSNIVVNAIQACPGGQAVQVFTSVHGDRYRVQVTDRGGGIDPENLPRVFDPFFTTKPVGSGVGLGLSIAHQVVAAHQGEIKISSEPGIGTTVVVELPMQPDTIPGGRTPC